MLLCTAIAASTALAVDLLRRRSRGTDRRDADAEVDRVQARNDAAKSLADVAAVSANAARAQQAMTTVEAALAAAHLA